MDVVLSLKGLPASRCKCMHFALFQIPDRRTLFADLEELLVLQDKRHDQVNKKDRPKCDEGEIYEGHSNARRPNPQFIAPPGTYTKGEFLEIR